MTYVENDIVMLRTGKVHWTFRRYCNDPAFALIESQMTGRRKIAEVKDLKYWTPGA